MKLYNFVNFGLTGAFHGGMMGTSPFYGYHNLKKKGKALENYGKIKKGSTGQYLLAKNLGIGAEVGGYLLQDHKGYRENPNSYQAKPRDVAGFLLNKAGFGGALSVGANMGHKFQELINEKTDEYMKKHPSANRSAIRKKIKKKLYDDGKVDLSKIKEN